MKFYYLWRKLSSFAQVHILRKEPSRQPFLIASIHSSVGPDAVHKHLIEIGFQPNYFAYVDRDELYNLRRLKFVDAELWQEHIRIFPDELRGHFEITYEEDARRHVDGSTATHLPFLLVADLIHTAFPKEKEYELELADAELRAFRDGGG